PMDEQNHGTHCAGTIAGAANNGVGVVGVSWKTQIMALRFLGPDGSGSTSDGVHCIDWAVEHGAHILSNSWSGPETSRELSEAVARAEKRGVLFVAAAGNTANGGNDNDVAPNYPASLPYPNIISVGAIDVNDARGSFSHYGKKTVDIGAPGVGIVSTVRAGEYAKYDGTSMATPHVAGAAALIWAKTFSQPAQDPNQMQTVRDLIYENARPVPALAEFWGHNAPARVKGGVLDISFLAQADNDNLPPSPGPTETTNPPIAANPTNPVINPNSTPTIASSQFGSGKVSIRTSGTISATKIVLKQPSVVHITANTSVASQNGGTRFTTGFSNQEPSDKIWLESARYIQVRSPGEWVNFGSTVSVNLPAGEHTIRWKIWRESSQSAELKFDSGSMLIQAYPVSAPPQTARSTSMSTSKKPVEAAIKIMDRPNNSSQRNR
ncbi:MAG: hypothetical protein FJ267_14300, partial [Planctomycetes bacterium]|nr:hypothetical protein [Planctomycetota bacterium]